MRVKATTNFDGMDRFKAAAAGSVARGLNTAAIAHTSFMKQGMTRLGRFTPSAPGSPPNVRRGDLVRNIYAREARSTGAGSFVSSGVSGHPSSMIHEKGGVIRPKRGKYIPVPLNINAMRLQETHGGSWSASTETFAGVNGSSGFIATTTFNGGLRRLDLHVERSKNGSLFLVGKRPKRFRWSTGGGGWLAETAIPRWVLKREVRLPARPFVVPAYEKNKPAIHAAAVRGASLEFKRLMRGGS